MENQTLTRKGEKMKSDTIEVESKTLTLRESLAAKYNVTDAKIAELKSKAATLKINGIDDKAGYLAVRENRLELVRLRGKVEAVRKEEKAESLEYGRVVDAEARRITAELESIEAPLSAAEKAIDAEIQAKKDAEQKIITDRANARRESLQAVGFMPDFTLSMSLAGMEQLQFDLLLEEKTELFNFAEEKKAEEAAELEFLRAEKAKQDADTAEKKQISDEAERETLSKQKIEQDRIAKEQAESAAKIKAERDKLDADKLAAARAAELERVRRETEARVIREAEEKKIRDQQAEAAAKIKADAEAKRLAELAPDKEKLKAYSEALRSVAIPKCGKLADGKLLNFHGELERALEELNRF